MRKRRGRALSISGGLTAAAVVVISFALLPWPEKRYLYIKLVYEPYPKFVEVTPSSPGGVTREDRRKGRIRHDYRRKRVSWIPGPAEALERYLCGPCLDGNHDECRRKFIMMVRGDWSDATQHFFHCQCQHAGALTE